MDGELENVELVIEVYDDFGNFEGEWCYEVSRDAIEQWETADQVDAVQGLSMVRFLLLSRLAEHSPITWELLKNNVCMGEFVIQGIPKSIEREIPRLKIVNIAVDRMYNCLSNLVIDECIRTVH